jgi:hypothetical protein
MATKDHAGALLLAALLPRTTRGLSTHLQQCVNAGVNTPWIAHGAGRPKRAAFT